MKNGAAANDGEKAGGSVPVWGKELQFTQNRHVNGLDFSIGVPDGFVVREDVEDSVLGTREFIIYWPNAENPDNVMDSPLAMFAQPQYQSSEKPLSRENWQYVAQQFADQFANLGMAHDIFSEDLENISYVAHAHLLPSLLPAAGHRGPAGRSAQPVPPGPLAGPGVCAGDTGAVRQDDLPTMARRIALCHRFLYWAGGITYSGCIPQSH